MIWNIRYADDTTLLARNRQDLSRMAETLRRKSRIWIRKKKTTRAGVRQHMTVAEEEGILVEVKNSE